MSEPIELTSAELDERIVAFVEYGPLRSYDHVALMERVLGPSLVMAEEVRDRLGSLTGWNLTIRSLARSGLEARKAEESMAARDVLAERKRQVEAEGWVPEHDDQHTKGEMAKAAASYAVDNVSLYPPGQWNIERRSIADWLWPWDLRWWKPTNRRRNLVKAGALILAEIERLDRAAIRALPLTTEGAKP